MKAIDLFAGAGGFSTGATMAGCSVVWAAKFTLPVSLEDYSGFGEHDERTDEWYCPEGWYEWNEHEEIHWRVTETPRAWAPLPPTTSAGSGKGE